jgi:hypothetical protein
VYIHTILSVIFVCYYVSKPSLSFHSFSVLLKRFSVLFFFIRVCVKANLFLLHIHTFSFPSVLFLANLLSVLIEQHFCD